MKTTAMIVTILGSALLSSAAPAATVGDESVLPASPQSAHEPNVAFAPAANGAAGGKYLVTWQSGMADKADIYACRVDESGKALDAKAFAVSKAIECQERPRAAWGKDSWLVVWADLRNDKDYDVYAARVSGDGKVLDPDGILIAGDDPSSPSEAAGGLRRTGRNQCRPAVAYNGEHFLVVWRSFKDGRYFGHGARVSADGKVLDAQPIKVGEEEDPQLSVGEPVVGAANGKWLAAWVAKGSSLRNLQGSTQVRMRASTITADGKVTTTELARSGGMDNVRDPVALASNGKDACLLSWFNSGTGGRSGPGHGMPFGALRSDLDGKKLGVIELGGKKVEIIQPSVAWDGKGYLIAFYAGGRWRVPGDRPTFALVNTIQAHLVAEDGKYEGKVEIASGKPNPVLRPAACGDGKGNTLVAYERHPADNDPAEATIIIAAKLVKR